MTPAKRREIRAKAEQKKAADKKKRFDVNVKANDAQRKLDRDRKS